MKVLIPIIKNPVYSQLIFSINKREVYASQLQKELNKSQGTIQKHLIFLTKQKYLIMKEHPEKKKNIKLFSINWEKINKEFFKFMLAKSKNPEFKISEKYAKNKYLSFYFKEIFSFYKEINVKVIEEIFDSLSISLLESFAPFSNESKSEELAEFYKFLELINPSNWENIKFINKSEKILYEISTKERVEECPESLTEKEIRELIKKSEEKRRFIKI